MIHSIDLANHIYKTGVVFYSRADNRFRCVTPFTLVEERIALSYDYMFVYEDDRKDIRTKRGFNMANSLCSNPLVKDKEGWMTTVNIGDLIEVNLPNGTKEVIVTDIRYNHSHRNSYVWFDVNKNVSPRSIVRIIKKATVFKSEERSKLIRDLLANYYVECKDTEEFIHVIKAFNLKNKNVIKLDIPATIYVNGLGNIALNNVDSNVIGYDEFLTIYNADLLKKTSACIKPELIDKIKRYLTDLKKEDVELNEILKELNE